VLLLTSGEVASDVDTLYSVRRVNFARTEEIVRLRAVGRVSTKR